MTEIECPNCSTVNEVNLATRSIKRCSECGTALTPPPRPQRDTDTY